MLDLLKTLFIITVATGKVFMPGSEPVKDGPDPFMPIRSLSIDYWCETNDAADIKAVCKLPEGLKAGKSVELVPIEQGTGNESARPKAKESREKPPQKVSKYYWGSSETVLEGQPKIQPVDSKKTFSEDNKMSHVIWPGPGTEALPADISAVGTYKLTSETCGTAEVTLDTQQDFLGPVEPIGLDKGVEIEKAIKIEWKPVPNALAYLVSADGYGEKENVHWTTSKDPEKAFKLYETALTEDELKKHIEEGILLPATAVQCTIPAGIFNNTATPSLSIVAFGKDIVQKKGNTEKRVIIRSYLTALLLSMERD